MAKGRECWLKTSKDIALTRQVSLTEIAWVTKKEDRVALQNPGYTLNPGLAIWASTYTPLLDVPHANCFQVCQLVPSCRGVQLRLVEPHNIAMILT